MVCNILGTYTIICEDSVISSRNVMGDKRFRATGVALVFFWIIAATLLRWWIVRKVTPKSILLGEYSCSLDTDSECVEKQESQKQSRKSRPI